MLKHLISAMLIVAAIARSAKADADTVAQYPNLPPAKNYLHVAHIAVDTVGKKWKLTEQQKVAAFRFIFHRYPVRDFEKMNFTSSPPFKPGELEACDVVSQQMAVIIIRDALHTYCRKVLHPDALTRPLFPSTSDRATEDAVAGILRTVSRDEFLHETKSKFPIRAGDTFYFYATSFGGGYLVVRGGKVVKDEVTMER